jgi:hypothetical protein
MSRVRETDPAGIVEKNRNVPETSSPACPNCGALLSGPFCSQCGEKKTDAHDKRFSHLFHEAFHLITHFEGTFFTTFKTIFTRPGRYSLDFTNGQRRKYIRPLSLLLLLVVLYLVFPLFQGLNMRLSGLVAPQYKYDWLAVPLVRAKMQHGHTWAEVAQHYDSHSPTVSKIGIFTMLPFCAIALGCLFFYKRRYFYDHFILAIELVCFYIAYQFLLLPFLAVVSALLYRPSMNFFTDESHWFEALRILGDLSFVTFALSRFYAQKWWKTIPQALLYLIAFYWGIVYVYHLLVLIVTMAII